MITIWLFTIAMENHHVLIGKPVNLYTWAMSHGYVE